MPTKKPLSDNPACLPVLVPVAQVRRLLGIGRVRLSKAIASGDFPPPISICGREVFRRADIAPTLVLAGLERLLPTELRAAAGDAAEAPK